MSQEKKGKEEEGVTFRYSSVFSLYKYIYVCIPPSLEAVAERASWPISLVYVEKMRGSLHLQHLLPTERYLTLTRQAKTNENNTCG